MELLDFILLEDDSMILLLEDDKTLELLDLTLLEDDSITLLLEDDKILELLDFTLLEDDSAALQEETSLALDESSNSSSPPIGSPVAVQATKKEVMKPAKNSLKSDLFIRGIYIFLGAFAIFSADITSGLDPSTPSLRLSAQDDNPLNLQPLASSP